MYWGFRGSGFCTLDVTGSRGFIQHTGKTPIGKNADSTWAGHINGVLYRDVLGKSPEGLYSVDVTAALAIYFRKIFFQNFFFSKFEIWGNFVFGKASQGVQTLSDIFQKNIFPKFFFFEIRNVGKFFIQKGKPRGANT